MLPVFSVLGTLLGKQIRMKKNQDCCSEAVIIWVGGVRGGQRSGPSEPQSPKGSLCSERSRWTARLPSASPPQFPGGKGFLKVEENY